MTNEIEQFNDYSKEMINGIFVCSFCKISEEEINGNVKNHAENCKYRNDIENFELIQEFAKKIVNGTSSLDSDIAEIIHDNLWELL